MSARWWLPYTQYDVMERPYYNLDQLTDLYTGSFDGGETYQVMGVFAGGRNVVLWNNLIDRDAAFTAMHKIMTHGENQS